jgi:hypothetical protein
VKGFYQVIIGPEVEARHAVIDTVAGRDDEHAGGRIIGFKGAQQVEAVAVGQSQVEQHAVVAVQLYFFVGLGKIGGYLHYVPALPQCLNEGGAQGGLVFN